MSPEERDELVNFILQSQSNAAEEHRNAMMRMAEFDKELHRVGKELDRVGKEIEALALVSHDLVEVARIHARRLDRLENPNL